MAYKYILDEIYRLSQEEGLNDREIAEMLGCSRVTVNRLRTKHDIPRANLYNRKDKFYICAKCGETVYIRRRDRRRTYCEKCAGEVSK